MKYQTELISKETITEGTMAFHFKKPAGFAFKAGQYIDMTIVAPTETDNEGNVRTFTIASSPDEEVLTFATRMRDTAFKRILKNAAPGFAVELDGPMGSFTLHQNTARPAIFLVGGIGITPFISMIKDATARALPHTIALFYSNRKPEDTAFLEELELLAIKNEHLTFIPTMTDMKGSPQAWTGATGRITKALIEKYVPERTNALYYMAGPQAMVAAMRTLANDIGVNDDDVKTEEFSGY